VKRRRVAFAFPLIATPELKKSFHPNAKLPWREIWELAAHQFKHLNWRIFVADGCAFNGIQHFVRHQIILVGLVTVGGAKLGRRRLLIYSGQSGNGMKSSRTFRFEPA